MMLAVEKIILPLLLIITNVTLVLFVIFYNKKIVKNVVKSIDGEYKNYKEELKNQNNSLTNQLIKQISENKNIFKEGSEKNLMGIFVKLRESIKENCIVTMNQLGAGRIAIYLFHNGVTSTHGVNFFKMSCICEKVAIGSGVRERMMEHTNIPVNLFDDMIQNLLQHNRHIIINNEETQRSNHNIFISASKIHYTQLVAIYDLNNNALGFVCVEMDKPFIKEDAEKEKEVLDELIKQLVPVLSYSDYIYLKTQ